MNRLVIMTLLAALCLFAPMTVKAQQSNTGTSAYAGNYGEQEEEEEEMSSGYSYEEEEEEEMMQGGYYAPPTYGTEQTYEEEYESYDSENYNYNSGSYVGNSSSYYNNQPNNSYSSNQGYSGQYDSSSSSSTPVFPSSLLTGFVVDIHFLAVDTHFQYIAYHYCSDLFPGYTQCAIYNGTASNSRLIATEMVVSEEIFKTLPLSERKLYHSHAFSVKNGLLVLPGVPADQEEQVYKGVMSTYGKVVDYWHSFQDFPLGPPRLAYGLATASQINTTIADQLDESLKLSTTWQQRQAERASWTMPDIVEGANDYLTSGVYPQYVIEEFNVSQS